MTPPADTRRASWRSPAKVNLCLRIVGRRDDGYHLLDSVFVPIDLCDRLTVAVTGVRRGGDVTVVLRCDDPRVPTDGTNLVARAATTLLGEAGVGATITVELAKRIPPGSGLGGGSGNAATTLLGLNALLELGTPVDRLRAVALRLGADVPFFLTRRPARVRGIGENIEAISCWPDTALIVAIPSVSVSTPWAFRTFRDAVPLDGEPKRETEAAMLASGTPPTADLLVNDLERAVLPSFPQVAALKKRLVAAGATAAVMSGSGSAVVALASSLAAARAIAARVGAEDAETVVHAVRVFRPSSEDEPAPLG
jgi:4-diphosphocytidyl-2-C-methyl-D-erythritol kinase